MDNKNFYFIVNFLRTFIESNEKLSIKQKDILSLQVIISVVTSLGIISNLLVSMTWELLLELFYSGLVLIQNIKEIFETDGQVMTLYRYNPQINFDISVEIKFVAVTMLYALINILLVRYVKKDHGIIMMISLVLQIGTVCLIYDSAWKLVLCIIAFLFIIITLVPIGKGKYFNVIKYAEYFLDAFKESPVQFDVKNKKKYIVQAIKIFVAWVLFFLTLLMLFPTLTFQMNLLISVSTVFIIFMNTSNKMSKFIKKAFIYCTFIPIVIIGNNMVESGIFSMLILFITVFFTFDRIISLSKDAKEIIQEYSIMYYIEEEIDELKSRLNFIFPITFFSENNFSELEIVRQMILCYKMNWYDQFKELYKIYLKTSFHNYLLLLGGMNYYLIFDEEGFSEREMYLRNLFTSIQEHEQKINHISISVEYAYILYHQKKDYELIRNLLEPIEQTLDGEMKGILEIVRSN